MLHAIEVHVLGPQRRSGESCGGQDDAVSHRKASFVREMRRFQRKRGCQRDLPSAAYQRSGTKRIVLTAPAPHHSEDFVDTHGGNDEPARIRKRLGKQAAILIMVDSSLCSLDVRSVEFGLALWAWRFRSDG